MAPINNAMTYGLSLSCSEAQQSLTSDPTGAKGLKVMNTEEVKQRLDSNTATRQHALHQQRNTVTEQMSWVGGLGEVKVSSVDRQGTTEAVLQTQHGTHTLFNNSECNSLKGGHSDSTLRTLEVSDQEAQQKVFVTACTGSGQGLRL